MELLGRIPHLIFKFKKLCNGAQMVGFYKIQNVKARDAYDEEKAYVSPVGTQEIQDYKDHGYTLTQTAAWQ